MLFVVVYDLSSTTSSFRFAFMLVLDIGSNPYCIMANCFLPSCFLILVRHVFKHLWIFCIMDIITRHLYKIKAH